MKVVRASTEAEVIAEFLKSEYHQKEYHGDREKYESVVFRGDITNGDENEVRKVLLFRRHRITWNELPHDIRWFLVQLEEDDIQKLRVFPRGHWPKMAGGPDLTLSGVANSIRERKFSPSTNNDLSAIHALSYRMRQTQEASSIILIGVRLEHRMTILEGNHRMLAATLVNPDMVCRFRTYVGLSTQMDNCYWYRSENSVFLRHAWRRMKNLQPRFTAVVKSLSSPLFTE